jgi:primosomal protein N' (replication factor Y)
MIRIVMRDQDPEKLNRRAAELSATIAEAAERHGQAVSMQGPMPCPIERIAGFHRAQIVLKSGQAARLQRILAEVRESGALARNERIAVDVDPVALL